MFGKINTQLFRASVSLFCMLAAAAAMNIAVFPAFDGIYMYARDISVLASAVAMALVGVAAAWKPKSLHMPAWSIAAWVLYAAGSAGLFVAFALQNPALLVLSASAGAVARAYVTVLVGVQLSLLDARGVRRAIGWAFMFYAVFAAFTWILPAFFGYAAFVLLPCAAFALSWAETVDFLGYLRQVEPPGERAVTQPFTLLPLGGTFFACLFFFRVAFGFSLRAGATPLAEALAGVPVIVFALFLLLSDQGVPDDRLTKVSVLFVVAGFLLGGSAGYESSSLSIACLSVGNTLFDMMAWALLANAARQNPEASLVTIAWGRGITGVGSIVGAALGVGVAAQASARTVWTASAVAVFTIVAFALLVLDRFSFDRSLAELSAPSNDVAELPPQTLEERCDQIAQEHGLTKREAEVFAMLARGRDRAYIEEQLVVSRNTVKAHVKHIYGKLNVHSHQELLDMVEEAIQ